jgi:hypothetical protein
MLESGFKMMLACSQLSSVVPIHPGQDKINAISRLRDAKFNRDT